MSRFDFCDARLAMIDSQLRTNFVNDSRVLEAFDAVPRECFVPDRLRGVAYIDEDLPLGNGRWLIEPMVLARLIQLAAIGPRDRVLTIGDPTGYSAVIVEHLAAHVVMLECDAAAAAAARRRLTELGYGSIEVVEGALEHGHPTGAPYDVIVLAGATAHVPHELCSQLAENGRIVAVIRKANMPVGEGEVMTRVDGVLSRRPVFDAGTPYLPGYTPVPSFVF